MNGSPKTSVNTAVNTVLTHAPGKTRVYLQKTGYTREIPGSASMPRAPYSQGHAPTAARTVCSSTRTAPCALATSAKRHGLQVAVRTMRSCRHSASSATLGRGLHRRVDPLAERQGALAAHAAGVVRLEAGLATEVLAFFWHPHHIAHHPRVHQQFALLAALCAAAFWCSKTSLHAAQANGPSLPFIALRPVSAHRPASAWACGRRRDNSGLWWRSFKEFAPDSPASNGACQHLPRGGVNTFENLYGCGVNR